MNLTERAAEVFKTGFVCDNCFGRAFANLLSGFTNEERGKFLRHYLAMLVDAGEKIDVDASNFYGIKFRNVKISTAKPVKCRICQNFFLEKIDEAAKTVAKKMNYYNFDTFLIGSVLPENMQKAEEEIWNKVGIEFAETIKSEINREVGKRVEKLTGKKFNLRNPDLTAVVDIATGAVRLQVRSLFVYGEYQKLVRGIPQTKWICSNCRGKGCKVCHGTGKLYKTSVQEIIEKPLLKAAKSNKSAFHGGGREDIDARCLAYRPFVIEFVKPRKRKIDLKKFAKAINKSNKVKVRNLKFANKDIVRKIKLEKLDKTYEAIVEFSKRIDKKFLKNLQKLVGTISQQTPLRVAHRRANLTRTRGVKKISYKILARKKLKLKIRAESGLYIKELITGEEGRTKPSISELLNNKVKKISLDIVKIHTK